MQHGVKTAASLLGAALLSSSLSGCDGTAPTKAGAPSPLQETPSMFRNINDQISVSPQITVAQIAEAKALDVALIINNRPDGESTDQTPGADIEAAAQAAGIRYITIPVTHSGFSAPQVDAMIDALENAGGKTLAYCRSGTRSTLLWSLAQAKQGTSPDEIARLAGNAGYDITPVRAMIDALASGQ